jgi:hypothetical protein
VKIAAAAAASQLAPVAVAPVVAAIDDDDTLPASLDRVIDRLVGEVEALHPAAYATYRAHLRAVIALDPALLTAGVGQPITALDEAAIDLAVHLWAEGMRLGARLALAGV